MAQPGRGDVIPFRSADESPELPKVSPGQYTGTYTGHAGAMAFRTAKLRVDFLLLEHPGLVLPRWYRVLDYRGGRVRAGRHSSLVRELSAALGQRLRHDRIAVASLKGVVVRVLVRDVVRDSEQNELHRVNQYSVIERILGKAEA